MSRDMSDMPRTVLLLEDEPLILMDLDYAAQDLGCTVFASSTVVQALELISEHHDVITVAVLDVSLGEGRTCFEAASELDKHEIPFILHSGDLDRHDEKVRELDAELIAKPAPAEKVIAAAIAYALGETPDDERIAAE